MSRRIWIACVPAARDAVNMALVDLAGGTVMRSQYPQSGEVFGEPPPAVMYFEGWQDDAATIASAEAAIAGIAGVVVVPGVPDGIADDSAGESDPNVGGPDVMRSRPGALRYARAALGVTLTDADLGLRA